MFRTQPLVLGSRKVIGLTYRSAHLPYILNRFAPRLCSTLRELFHGNIHYMSKMSSENPGLLRRLAEEGQRPPFMLIICSDSRVNEQEIFSAKPGTLFTAGNVANRFDETDLNSNAVLSFAVASLKVKHIIVLGHYGCGGVAAAMMPQDAIIRAADVAVQSWISPIRHIYETSSRKEITLFREKSKRQPLTMLPDLHDPAFRALVEENVKFNVQNIENSSVIRNHYKALSAETNASLSSTHPHVSDSEIYIHGWVYDIEDGKVSDLGVSVGAPGKQVPRSPFPRLN